MGLLDGVRVIDVTRLLPGGYCTMLLSDMGAEVVKVEEPGLGDYMRATPPTSGGRSPVHATANRNKLSIGIDLKKAEGKEVLRRLVKRADVFVEGFRPGAMDRLGFSFADVKRLNPRIVYCSISSFGQNSPKSGMPAHDIDFQAMAGSLDYAVPAVPLIQLGDTTSGLYAAFAIASALAARGRRAIFIDVPIVQSLLSTMIVALSAYLATGEPPREGHSLVFGSEPYYGLYRTLDGKHMAVAAIEDRFWQNLVEAMGVPEIRTKRFGTPAERREVLETLKATFATKTRDEWASILMEVDTCAVPVLSAKEAVESGWARSSKVLAEVKGDGTVINTPLRSNVKLRSGPFRPAPSLGEHTDAIMGKLGYTAKAIKMLKRSGAVQ
jgi:alpha-methylacyl-CoA racemase